MRAVNAFLASAVASITASTAIAFRPPLPHAPGSRITAFSSQRAKTSLPTVAVADNPSQETDLPLPPRDETFTPFRAVKEVLASPDFMEDAGRYDRVGRLTGGVWRTIILGSTVVTFQQGWKWIVKQEAAGNIYQKFPKSVVGILGEKALNNLSEQPELHSIGRKPYSDALSPKSVLEMQPFLETVIRRKVLKLEGLAKSGQELSFQDELRGITLESIAGVFFGDYATPKFTEDIKRYLPAISSGLISIPIRFPWPLNKIPLLGFGRSMDAREALKFNILDVLEKRRADLTSVEESRGGGKSAGLLDSFMKIQQGEMATEAGRAARFFDDNFIVDNVVSALFAGTESTAVTLTRLLQLLKTADDGKEITDKLIQELSSVETSNVELDATLETGSGGASRAGILGAFPLLDAVILESFRLHPVIPAVFRKSRVDVTYNGYRIPEGKFINCNIVHGLRAESLYPEPKKFCPFRFLHGGKINDRGASTSSGEAPAVQPPPPMFSAGKHMCPGRELAKLEILLFLKEFLPKFDHELVEGQSFKGVLPSNGPKDRLRVFLKLKSAA